MRKLLSVFIFYITTFFSLHAVEPLTVTLEKAKALALANSKELQMVAFQLKGAKDRYDLGIRDFLPRVQVGYGGSETVIIDSPDNSSNRLNLTITQPLYNGGRTSLQRSMARTALLLESNTFDRKEDEILDGIFNLFYRILILEEQKKLQQEIYLIARDQFSITEKEMSIGQIREIDLIETELEVRSLEIQLKSSETNLEELYFEFNKAIGEDIQTKVSVTGSINIDYSGLALDETPGYYYNLALQNNIQFRKNDFEMKKSVEELKMAEKSFLPRIDSETTFTLSGTRFPLQDTGVTFKLNISFPMEMFPVSTALTAGIKNKEYNRGTNTNVGLVEDITFPLNRKQAKVNLQMMKVRETELKETFKFQIEKSLVKYRQKKETLSLRREYLSLQKRKIRIQEKQFDVGEIKRLDLLKSKSSLFKEEIDLLQQVLELITTERSFEILLGIEPGTLPKLAKEEKAG